MNTKKRGILKIIMFRDEDGDYCAVCLNLNLIEWGDDPDNLLRSIIEAATSYVNAIIEKDMPDELLNRPAPNKYWDLAKKKVNKSLLLETNTLNSEYFSLASRPYTRENDSVITA